MTLLVHYTVEATVLGEDGEEIESRTSDNVKRIRLTSLTSNSDIKALAREIVDKCKLIHPSKVGKVQKLLAQLQDRAADGSSYFARQQAITKMKSNPLSSPTGNAASSRSQHTRPRAVSMARLDAYIEQLYEGEDAQAEGTGAILALAQEKEAHLQVLTENETLLLALSRLLKETAGLASSNSDVAANILQFFFELSKYSVFHTTLSSYGIGRCALRVIEVETKRHAAWMDKLHAKEEAAGDPDADQSAKSALDKQLKITRRKEEQQERILFVSLHLLLNLAEDLGVEKKLRKKAIASYLVDILERRNLELLILVTTFLKKLSIYQENKDDMKRLGVVEKLALLLSAKNSVLLSHILDLLINLSFDKDLVGDMIKYGILSSLAELVRVPAFSSKALNVLYHISVHDEHKGSFGYGVVSLIRARILEDDERYLPEDLMALAINLAMEEKTAVLLCEDGGLELYIQRVLATGDSLLMKFIANLGLHPGDFKMMFLDYIDELVSLAKKSGSNPEFQVEALALLGSLAIPNFNYERLLEEYDLLSFATPLLDVASVPDDVALQAVVFVGTVAVDPETAPRIAATSIIPDLMALMSARQEDDAFVLHITYAFYFFALNDPTRQVFMAQPHSVAYMIDLLQDRNVQVRRLASTVLDIVVEHDPSSATEIQRMKFQAHNAEWLEVMAGQDPHAYAASHHHDLDLDDNGMDTGVLGNLVFDSSSLLMGAGGGGGGADYDFDGLGYPTVGDYDDDFDNDMYL